MNGSYQLQNFTKNRETEVTRLKSQVELFFEREFDIYRKTGLKDNMDILECGSGPGYLIKSIVQRLPGCNATALEIDPFLFSVLSENSESEGRKLYRAVNGSIYETGFSDNSFDFIVTRLVIEHLEKPLKAIAELRRILRPGGKLVIVSNDFAYHLLTFPMITELNEMYDAYCRSRLSEGGNPYIARQLPVYLEKSGFGSINLDIVTAHSRLSGDEPFLKAENVNISKSLVEAGFLNRNSLASLVEKWFDMLRDPNHIFYRQLFVVSGQKSETIKTVQYSETLEDAMKWKMTGHNNVEIKLNKLDQQKEKFRNLLKKNELTPAAGGSVSSSAPAFAAESHDLDVSQPSQKIRDIGSIEAILLDVWKEILKRDTINKDDNYFDIGGDSVLIPEMVLKLADVHNIKIRILDIFDNPSIARLAEYIRKEKL